MRRSNTLVFDEYIHASNNPTITSQDLNLQLSAYDQLAIQAEVDNVAGGSGTFTVQIFHSSDGRNWLAKNLGGPEISASIPSNPHLFGYDAGTTPSLGMVQLRINLPASVGAHVKIHVAARDWGGR